MSWSASLRGVWLSSAVRERDDWCRLLHRHQCPSLTFLTRLRTGFAGFLCVFSGFLLVVLAGLLPDRRLRTVFLGFLTVVVLSAVVVLVLSVSSVAPGSVRFKR